MFLIDLLFAFVIALVAAAILAPLIAGGTRSAAAGGVEARAAFWPAFMFVFLIVLAVTWAGGIWTAPFGPPLWGSYWLPFLIVGFVVALLIAAMIPRKRRRRRGRRAAGVAASPGGPQGKLAPTGPERAEDEDEAGLILGIFFWAVIMVLALAILIGYA